MLTLHSSHFIVEDCADAQSKCNYQPEVLKLEVLSRICVYSDQEESDCRAKHLCPHLDRHGIDLGLTERC